MTKGQRARAVAVIHPEPEKGGGKKGLGDLKVSDFSGERLSKARTVLRYAPQLTNNVLSGGMSLDAAHQIAHDAKLASESEETRFALLRQEASDLADLVIEELMSLVDAENHMPNGLSQNS
jgi:hypothetical protein